MLKSTKPPYNDIEYKLSPSLVVGGKNIEPIEAANTAPRPMASGPFIFKNFSLGAVAAIKLRPPTIPAVYQAAFNRTGPPNKVIGAIKPPRRPACKSQAKCLPPICPS